MLTSIFKKVVILILQTEAKLVLKKYKPKIVAVTGSVGKTSTKDAIFTILSSTYFVRKTSKSFNSEIGVPLTILGLPNAWNSPAGWFKNVIDGFLLFILPHEYPAWLVLEIGADRPGDIASIMKWVRPDVAVVTRIGDVPVHVEFYGSVDEVRHEKSHIVRAAGKESAIILNADDDRVVSMKEISKAKVITYGIKEIADLRASDFGILYGPSALAIPVGIGFNVNYASKQYPVEIHDVVGRQQVYSSLAALAVACALGLEIEASARSLLHHESPPGRMKLLSGKNGSCIIDDTYNSSPVAAVEALETLKMIHTDISARKIAVLGDMLELGSHSFNEHIKLGLKAIECADVIYTVGLRAAGIHEAAIASGFSTEKIYKCNDSTEAGELLRNNIKEGDIVLVKGSQGMRMEKAVAMILAEPAQAGELLVRQEIEWQQR